MTYSHRRQPALTFLYLCAIAGLLGYRFASTPPLWWDEGWTLSVARNWVVHGHYGQINDGIRVAGGLAGHFPTVAAAAASFALFGVGAWQARLPFLLLMFGCFGLLYVLSRILYGPRTAFSAVLISILLPISGELQPLLVGRQALGEPVMLFSLLSGCLLLWLGLERKRIFLAGAALSWGLALSAKAQLLPFWLAAVGLALFLLLLMRHTRQAAWLAITGFAGYQAYHLLIVAYSRWMAALNGNVSNVAITGLLDVTAFVPSTAIRWINLQNGLTFGWWVVGGLVWAAWSHCRRSTLSSTADPNRIALQAFLFGLVSSWFCWYLALGMLWVRYLFPVTFIGSLFAAAWFSDLLTGFDLKRKVCILCDFSAAPSQQNVLRLFALLLLAGMLLFSSGASLFFLVLNYRFASAAPTEMATFINSHVPPDATIETYDPELFFLSNHRFHFPPDQVHIQLIERTFIDPATAISYDPLTADPDYLLVGPFSRRYGLYDSLVESGAFTIEAEFPGYVLYIRSEP